MAEIMAVRAGQVRFRHSPGRDWTSAIAKRRITGLVHVGWEGIAGDAQADRVNHGGRDKAVLAYCTDHYTEWRLEFQNPDFGPGVLGENLEVAGQSEADVCIGDRYRAGNVLFELSQPRQPCWKPALLHGYPHLTRRMTDTSRTGWYLRVLQPGTVEPPCEIELLDRPHPQWTVLRANRLVYQKSEPAESRLLLASLAELSPAWKHMLRERE